MACPERRVLPTIWRDFKDQIFKQIFDELLSMTKEEIETEIARKRAWCDEQIAFLCTQEPGIEDYRYCTYIWAKHWRDWHFSNHLLHSLLHGVAVIGRIGKDTEMRLLTAVQSYARMNRCPSLKNYSALYVLRYPDLLNIAIAIGLPEEVAKYIERTAIEVSSD